LIAEKLSISKKRSKNVLGGYCGFYGACGAGVGTGLFMSVIQNCTPLHKEEWQKSNLMTAQCLSKIAEQGGPRCCKRDTYIALEHAIEFVKNNLNLELEADSISCTFSKQNKECKLADCQYY